MTARQHSEEPDARDPNIPRAQHGVQVCCELTSRPSDLALCPHTSPVGHSTREDAGGLLRLTDQVSGAWCRIAVNGPPKPRLDAHSVRVNARRRALTLRPET
jgi:hypothetical protein